ncbi:MAG: hypothetical protein SGPRY_011630 [Prymnesium sp.]
MTAPGGRRKVVVTGLGTFCSLGHDADTFFNNLLAGKCGIGEVSLFDPELAQVLGKGGEEGGGEGGGGALMLAVSESAGEDSQRG